ncbi:PAS domain-containing protein [Paraburkholderia sediminicola]|uniref:PAS domain-containing protein n=1 Tax=Paraburkholderia sediminicola TaxID=458836 RepID=UPI0038B8E1A8
MQDNAVVSELAAAAMNLDAYPVALLQVDSEGSIRSANAAWAELMDAGTVGVEMAAYVHPEDRLIWREMLARLRNEAGVCCRERIRFVHPHGQLRWLEVACRRHEDAFFISAFDTTAQKRQETSIEARLRSAMGLLNGVPGLIYRGRNNPSWSMEFVSDGCEELTGYPAAWFVDSHEHSYSQLIVPDDVDYVWRGVQEALADRRPFELRYRIRGANGDLRNVWERGVGIYSASSEVLGIEGAIFAVR